MADYGLGKYKSKHYTTPRNQFDGTAGTDAATGWKAPTQPVNASLMTQPTTGLTTNPNYGTLNKYQDQFSNMFDSNGGMGTAGTYDYAPSVSSVTGEIIPGGSIGVNEDAAYAINNPDSATGLGGGSTGPGLAGYGGMALNAVNAFNMYQQGKLAKQQLGLAREQFGFEKAATNRNLQNQASQYNTGLQNSGEVGMALAGNTMDTTARGLRQAQLDTQKLSTAVIG